MVEVWLSAGGTRVRLPVLPEKITIEAGGQHEKVTLHEAGEVLLAGKRTLRSLSLASYFPARYTSVCGYRNIPDPRTAADTIRGWAEAGTVVQLVITGGAVGANMPVIIESFPTTIGKQAGDVSYEMQLTEYRRLTVTVAQAGVFTLHPQPTAVPAPPKPRNPKAPASLPPIDKQANLDVELVLQRYPVRNVEQLQ